MEEKMSEEIRNQKEALAAAIDMEKHGQTFYKTTANKTKNPMTRDVFEFLSNEELKHIETIKKFYEAELAGEDINFSTLISDPKNENARKAIHKLFSGLDKKVVTEEGDMAAYKFARDFEKNGENFYRQAITKSKDPEVVKLFSFLVEEEKRHFQMIDDSIAFLENPEEWFHRQEKWHVEG
jgi:rubrerythrin